MQGQEKLPTGFVKDVIYGQSRVDLMHPNALPIIMNQLSLSETQIIIYKHVCSYVSAKFDGASSMNRRSWLNAAIAAVARTHKDAKSFILAMGNISAEGAKKYGAWNWYQGCPNSVWLTHAIIHLLDNELDKVAWNLLALLDQEFRIHNAIMSPEFDDIKLPEREKENV